MQQRSNNFIAGSLFLAIAALFGSTAIYTLDVGTPGEMGPGFFPILISLLLAGLGVAIMIARSGDDEPERKPIAWRGVLLVTLAPIVFAFSVRTIGLVPALLLSVTIAVAASRKIGWMQGVLIVLGMTIFCVAVFSYGIGLTDRLFIWPPQPF